MRRRFSRGVTMDDVSIEGTKQVVGSLQWRRRTRRRIVQIVAKVMEYVILSAIGMVLMVPFFWMVSTSFKPRGTEFLWPPQFIPDPPMPENYLTAWALLPFGIYLRNTLIITSLNMIGGITTSLMAAYAFSRLRFPYRDTLFTLCISTMMLPFVVTLVPSFVLFTYLGWVDTFLPLIVPNWLGASSFFVFLGRQFFSTIPSELEDAARMDGASSFRIWSSIMVPLSKPVIAAMAVFSFQGNWNAFMAPLIYLQDQEKLTLAVGLASLRGIFSTEWNLLMAISTVFTIPMVILFFLAQRHFMRGIVTTGLAGR